jgi:hypothetical protein
MVLKLFDEIPNLVRPADPDPGPVSADTGPSPLTCSLALAAACKLRRADRALQIARGLRARGLAPSLSALGQLVAALEAEGRSEDAYEMFEEAIVDHSAFMVRL